MNESRPPILEEKPTATQFAKFAAIFSVVAPLMALLLFCICVYGRLGLKIIAVVGLFPIPLILLGFIFGIIALVLAGQRKGLFGKAIVGICFNGLLLIFVIGLPFLLPIINGFPITAQGRLDKATNELAAASSSEKRFYALNDAAKESFNVGKIQDAENYANELLKMAPDFRDDWNYGNAIQDGNLVLGRIAAREGRMEDAKKYLLEAGKSPGSPQMDSFGPNMSLAKDLLEKGDRVTVLQYFELCRKFWKMDNGELDQWSNEVKAGKIPDFGANLIY